MIRPVIAKETAFALLLVAYACFALSLGNAPLQDVPNHLARAHIISDLLFNHGAVYGREFELDLSFSPYLSGDLALALLDRFMGTVWAARLWIAASIVLLPLGVRFALTAQGLSRGTAAVGGILALYVATGWLFTMGFLNFELAMACAFFAYGWFRRVGESNDLRSWSGYLLWLTLGYSMHLSAVVFIGTFVGTSLLLPVVRREMPVWRAAILLAPPCLFLLLHMGLSHASPGHGPSIWGTFGSKVKFLFAPVVRFGEAPEMALFLIWLGAAIFPVYRRATSKDAGAAQALWLCVAAFVALYFAMPQTTDNIAWVDVRAVPYALVFLIFAGAVATSRSPRSERAQFAAACFVVTANLVYVAWNLEPQNRALGHYRMIAAMVPAGASVLPISTRPPIGRCHPFQNAGSYVTLDAAAMTPYLFAADQNPPMAYFRYVDRGYAPSEFWYEVGGPTNLPGQPIWAEVQRQFQYLLVTVPWDAARIPKGYVQVARNDAAALLRSPRP